MTITAAPARRGRFLRMPDVVAATGISSATINRLHRRGEFPAKVRISANATGWWEGEVEAWKTARGSAAAPIKYNSGGTGGGTATADRGTTDRVSAC